MASEVAFDAPEEVRAALAEMGRTEDVRLSPNGRRLAFACFARGQIAIADVELARSEIAVTSLEYLGSPALEEPHGLDFVDDHTLVVGDRANGVLVLGLPHDSGGQLTEISRLDAETVDSPGSVAVRTLGSGVRDLLACNNFANTLTRVELGVDATLGAREVLVRKWLE